MKLRQPSIIKKVIPKVRIYMISEIRAVQLDKAKISQTIIANSKFFRELKLFLRD